MQASRKTGALQLYEVKVDLGDLQRCLQAEGQLFVQDSAETLLCYTQLHFVARMLTCNGARVCCRPACRCSSCMATLVPHHSPDLHHSLPTSNRLPCTPLNVYHVTNQSIFLVFFVTVHVHECLVPVPCLYPPLYRPSERVLRLNYSFLCQWWEGGAGRIFQGSEAPLKAGK